MDVHALLFDLDGTFYDRDQALLSWVETFVHAHLPVQQTPFFQEVVEKIISLHSYGYGPRAREGFFTKIKAIIPSLPYNVDELAELFYRQFPGHMFLDEGTRQFVQALEHSKIPFGIISNGSHRQISKIEALGLHRLTTCIFISDLFGCQKPEPEIFLAAAACLKTPAEKILFVGDDPYLDIYGAHRVGMRTAWLQRGQPWPSTLAELSADMTVHSLGELYPILSQTLEGRS